MKEKHQMTLDELSKGNVWTVTESELASMLVEGKKEEDYAEMEKHYMNIIKIESAGICFFQKIYTAKQSRFSSTRRTNNCSYTALFYIERNAFENLYFIK